MTPRPILAATDLSEAAGCVAAWTRAVGLETDRPVVAAHVLEVGADAWLRRQHAVQLDGEHLGLARETVAGWYRRYGGVDPADVEVRIGSCVPSLGDAVRARDAGLLAVARSSHGAAVHLALGSRVQDLASRPPCALAIVHPHKAPPGSRSRLAVGIDFSDGARAALREAVALAVPAGAELHLVHAVHVPGTPALPGVDVYPLEVLDRLATDAVEALRSWGEAVVGDAVPWITDVIAGPAVPTLRHYAESRDLDFLFLGRTGHTTGLGDRLGSVPRGILRTMPCTVVVAPRDGDAELAG
ncbi:MAG: universal stress protein [Planctomycetota bacterium]|jgi:nucleotide-binding universal stress UspA family protein